jgi:hypothetical protein
VTTDNTATVINRYEARRRVLDGTEDTGYTNRRDRFRSFVYDVGDFEEYAADSVDSWVRSHPLAGERVTEPRHGDRRDHGTRTTFSESGTSALTVTAAELYCRVHGWIQTDGVIGPLGWAFEHEDCGTPDDLTESQVVTTEATDLRRAAIDAAGRYLDVDSGAVEHAMEVAFDVLAGDLYIADGGDGQPALFDESRPPGTQCIVGPDVLSDRTWALLAAVIPTREDTP